MTVVQSRRPGEPLTDEHRAAIEKLTEGLLGLPEEALSGVSLGELHHRYLWAAGFHVEAVDRVEVTVDDSRLAEGLIGVTRWYRTRGQLNRDVRALGENPDDLPWRLIGGHLPGDATSRSRGPVRSTAAMTLAIYFLSHDGGGLFSRGAAMAALEQREWWGDIDATTYRRALKAIEREVGPLLPDDGITAH